MSAIPHTFTERNTTQSTSSTTYQSVTGIAQASTNFTVGKKYLIVMTAQAGHSVADDMDLQVIHGSTALEGGQISFRLLSSTASGVAFFSTVWEAVSSEGIDVQFRRNPSAGGTVDIDFVSLFTMQLTDYLTVDVDYFFNERTADDTLTGSYQAGGTVTLTPATASQDWLAMTCATMDYDSTLNRISSRLTESNGGLVVPTTSHIPNGVTASCPRTNLGVARVLTLPAVSTTVQEESIFTGGVAPLRLYSNVFLMNLNKFATHAFTYTADVSLVDTSGYTDAIQTVNITPTVTGDVWALGYFGFNKNAAARQHRMRLQLDNSDQPAGQTTAAYLFNTGHTGNSAADEVPTWISTVSSVSNAAHTYDLDGGVDSTTGTPTAQHCTLMAVTMELAAAGSRPMFRGS